MSKLILYAAVSKDGFIADAKGGVEWLEEFGKDDEDYGYHDFIKRLGAIVMGSTTYIQSLSFGDWPYGDIESFVLTHKDLSPAPKDTITFVEGDIVPVVEQAKKAAAEKDVWLLGGADIVAQCIDKNLIDQFMIFTMPVKIGEGIALPLPLFKTSENTEYDDGVVRTISPAPVL